MMFLLLSLFVSVNSLWYRTFNTVYVQSPEETPEEQRTIMEQRVQFWVQKLNEAMIFHELDFRFEAGSLHSKSVEYWSETGHDCGDVRKKFCTPWTDELGRKSSNTLEVWMCVMPDKIGCQGVGGGNTAAVKYINFCKDDKIGVLHEIGHCLGCGHKTKFCQPDFEQFAQVTGKRYQTLMGGGAQCNPKAFGGLQKLRLPYYEDKSKQYCESGVCLTLGDEGNDCMPTIRRKFEGLVENLKPYCDSDLMNGKNGVNFNYCISEVDTECTASAAFGTSDVSSVQDCVALLEDNESLCPSNTFYFARRRKNLKCVCCALDFDRQPGKYDLIKYKSDLNGNVGATQSYSMISQYSLHHFHFLFAIIGMLTMMNIAARILKNSWKYANIPEHQVEEI